MKDLSIILATDDNGNDITIGQVRAWLQNENRKELSDFFYYRFYGKYLKPHDFPNSEYKQKYKNGFAIMTSCCLLIETFVSFTEQRFRETNGKSERCFGIFFLTNPNFSSFTTNGLTLAQYKNLRRNPLKNTGIPIDFYKHIRCGLLHNGETRNGWKISRSGALHDELNKRINAVKFMTNLKEVIKKFQNSLLKSDFNNSDIWKNFKNRLTDLIDNS